MPDCFITNVEQDFISRCALPGKGSVRHDGRSPTDRRAVDLHLSSKFGVAHIVAGDNRMIAQVSTSMGHPTSSKPSEGSMHIQVDICPNASRLLDSNRRERDELNIDMTRILERSIKESGCVDMESLCIIANEKSWHLRVDLTVISYDGGAIDAACCVTLAALAHHRLPYVELKDGDLKIDYDESVALPLMLRHYPHCMTFGVIKSHPGSSTMPSSFDRSNDTLNSSSANESSSMLVDETDLNGSKSIDDHSPDVALVLDPTWQEECASNGRLIVAINERREICSLSLAGGIPIDRATILKYVNLASLRCRETMDLIKTKLEADKLARKQAYVSKAGRVTDMGDESVAPVGIASNMPT